jgi:uncharacterized protein YjbI with pentapeptide repeats
MCILHSEDSSKDPAAFNIALTEHRQEHGELFHLVVFPRYADFRSHEFTEDVSFSGATFLESVCFEDATFKGKAFFASTTFKGIADFGRATFNQQADFTSAEFHGEADFAGTTFSRKADVSSNDSSDEVSFRAAEFSGRTSFSVTRFEVRADFSGAKFVSKPHFIYTVFEPGAAFTGATFPEGVHFVRTQFGGLANFHSAVFDNETQFSNTVFSNKASFCNARLSGMTIFEPADDVARSLEIMDEIDRLVVKGLWDEQRLSMLSEDPSTVFGADVDFRDVITESPDALAFRDVDLSHWRFRGTDLRKAQFEGVDWAKIGNCFGFKRNAVYDEVFLLEKKDWGACAHIERLYRELKQNYEGNREYVTAGDFHYGEKEMRRLNPKTPRGLRFLLWLYWVVSGYGERCLWPLGWSLLLLVSCAATYGIFGLSTPPPNSMPVPVAWYEALRYSLQVMTLLKPNLVPVGEVGKWLHTLESILGPLLVGLFALALRQRLKR